MNQRFLGKRSFVLSICFIVGFVALLGLRPDKALACSCAYMPSSEESVNFALERDGVIFAGTVQKIDKPRNKWQMSSADEVKITLDVSEVWKGKVSSSTIVYTAQSSASCGYVQFAVGEAYLISAHDDGESKLVTSLCDMTMPLAAADEPVSMLGDSYAPEPAVPKSKINIANDETSTNNTLVAILVTASVVLLLLVAIVFVRRRGRRE